jgi:hypothetical protein
MITAIQANPISKEKIPQPTAAFPVAVWLVESGKDFFTIPSMPYLTGPASSAIITIRFKIVSIEALYQSGQILAGVRLPSTSER